MKVTFLIPGAGRSGTTTLYHHVQAHPQVCFSRIKEVPFFAFEDHYRKGPPYLHDFFDCMPGRLAGMADTYLLPVGDAPARVHRYNPEMKLIVMLRDPVARAWSSFHYALHNGYEKPGTTFLRAYREEPERLKAAADDVVALNNRCHFYGGLYYCHLRRWLEYFDRNRLLLLRTQDLQEQPGVVMQQVCDFLDLPARMPEDTGKKRNRSAVAHFTGLQRLLLDRRHPLRKLFRTLVPGRLRKAVARSGVVDKLHDINRQEKANPTLDNAAREVVADYFAEDQRKLKEVFGVELAPSARRHTP